MIADGKRGDIPVSAQAYAQALMGGIETPFGRVPGLEADLVTVNPLLGRDSIEPFVAAARERRAAACWCSCAPRIPGPPTCRSASSPAASALWERLAALVEELGAPGVGEAGLSDVGAVVAATAPEHLARARELMPQRPFLLPGVGAQGGRVEDLRRGVRAGQGRRPGDRVAQHRRRPSEQRRRSRAAPPSPRPEAPARRRPGGLARPTLG